MISSGKKSTGASLVKLFAIDDKGSYTGEYAIESECPIEFDDFVRAVGNMAMEDMQTVFVGEYRATMLHGARLSLIAISKGDLNSHELTWAKATLTTIETLLVQGAEEEATPSSEDDSQDEMKALQTKIEESESKIETERKRVQEMEAELKGKEDEIQEIIRERDALKEKGGELRGELEARDAKLQELDGELTAAKQREEQWRRELESLKEDFEAAREKLSSSDFDEARKDIERRSQILQKKALELLEKEERLHKLEGELSTVKKR